MDGIGKKMAEIFALNIENRIPVHRFQFFFDCFPGEKQKKIERLIREKDRERALVSELLIRYLSCLKLGLQNEDLRFDANEFGKPFLVNRPEFYYNITHSGDWVVIALSKSEVGIDIERIRKIDLDIAKKYFTDQEYLDINSRTGKEKREYFFDIWTLKESYVKALGQGLTISLKSFSFRLTRDAIVFDPAKPGDHYQFKTYDLDPAYKLAMCIKSGSFPGHIARLDLDAVYESGLFH